MYFTFDAQINKDGNWYIELPDGQIWEAFESFEGLVQSVGAGVTADYTVQINHPDQEYCPVIIGRGWKMS